MALPNYLISCSSRKLCGGAEALFIALVHTISALDVLSWEPPNFEIRSCRRKDWRQHEQLAVVEISREQFRAKAS